VVRSGYDLQEVLVGLAEHVRNLLVARSLGGDALEEVAESTRTRYADEADRFDEADLLRLLTMAGEAEDDIKQSPQPRLKLETVLLKMAQLRRSADLREVLEKIDRLEQMADEGELPDAVPGDGAAPEDSPSSASETDSSPSRSPDASEGRPEPESPDAAAEPVPDHGPEADAASSPEETPPSTGREESTEPPSAAEEASPAASEITEEEAPSESEDPEEEESTFGKREEDDSDDDPGGPEDGGKSETASAEPDGGAAVEYNDLFGTPALGPEESGGGATDTDATGSHSADTSGTDDDAQATAVAEPDSPQPFAASDDGLAAEWPRVVQAVKDEHISLGSLLSEAEPVECAEGTLTVTVPRTLHRDSLRDRRHDLLQYVTATVDRSIDDIRFVVDAERDESSTESGTSNEPLSPREQLQQLRDIYPALDVLFGEFEAEPVW
jgi:DNA polymerase-3 subunit gamma/tau